MFSCISSSFKDRKYVSLEDSRKRKFQIDWEVDVAPGKRLSMWTSSVKIWLATDGRSCLQSGQTCLKFVSPLKSDMYSNIQYARMTIAQDGWSSSPLKCIFHQSFSVTSSVHQIWACFTKYKQNKKNNIKMYGAVKKDAQVFRLCPWKIYITEEGQHCFWSLVTCTISFSLWS